MQLYSILLWQSLMHHISSFLLLSCMLHMTIYVQSMHVRAIYSLMKATIAIGLPNIWSGDMTSDFTAALTIVTTDSLVLNIYHAKIIIKCAVSINAFYLSNTAQNHCTICMQEWQVLVKCKWNWMHLISTQHATRACIHTSAHAHNLDTYVCTRAHSHIHLQQASSVFLSPLRFMQFSFILLTLMHHISSFLFFSCMPLSHVTIYLYVYILYVWSILVVHATFIRW